jgi:hypothetical protein
VLNVLIGLCKGATEQRHGPSRVVSLQPQIGIVELPGYLEQLVGDFIGQIEPAARG